MSLRTRLTVVYGALFLVTGIILEAATYAVTARAVRTQFKVLVTKPSPEEIPGSTRITSQNDMAEQIAKQQQAILDQTVQSAVLTLLALTVLSVLLGYLVSGWMVRPLQQMTATARRLSESTLHERIGLTGPRDEIKELADTFDGLLERLNRAFNTQRRFIANASHELRTPLTINRTTIDVALAKPGGVPDVMKTLGQKLLSTISRHERLLDGLLLLARSERELQDRSRVDLSALVSSAVDQLAETARRAGVTINQVLRPAGAVGDPTLLERCAINLIENAVKYNVAKGQIWVWTHESAGWTYLRVENTGPEVSPEQTESIFEPFRRLRADRVGSARGAGLGLSIVRAVMNAHEGTVQAHPRPTGGLVITLQLPAPTPQGHREIVRAASD
ncbi:HAMP domain-containing histidine kinase [Streptomyces oryzae]|uniref:histidine kinase n=2 Tax=Streptomyces oryzae TaxID=1434886 RepID=A0ABS3XAN4_9ACTN|nr:HAMP domain-containing histidine kinase [Streptomyces oryzae]